MYKDVVSVGRTNMAAFSSVQQAIPPAAKGRCIYAACEGNIGCERLQRACYVLKAACALEPVLHCAVQFCFSTRF